MQPNFIWFSSPRSLGRDTILLLIIYFVIGGRFLATIFSNKFGFPLWKLTWPFGGHKILQQLEKLNINLFPIYILLRSAHQIVGQFVAWTAIVKPRSLILCQNSAFTSLNGHANQIGEHLGGRILGIRSLWYWIHLDKHLILDSHLYKPKINLL